MPSALLVVTGMVVLEGVLLLLSLVVGGLDVVVSGCVAEEVGVDDVVTPVPATCRL